MDETPLQQIAGTWTGNYQLWMKPDAPPVESPTRLAISVNPSGRYATLAYDWTYDGRTCDGVLVVVLNGKGRSATASWVDTFHMSDAFMVSRGTVAGARVDMRGSYAAPPGPDWGWRTVVEADAHDTLRVVMYNVTPEGQEARAVEAIYQRVNG
jgi:hypothetical protein